MLEYIDGDDDGLGAAPLERLADEGGSRPTATTATGRTWTRLRDKMVLEEQWATGRPPWKTW